MKNLETISVQLLKHCIKYNNEKCELHNIIGLNILQIKNTS